MFHLIVLCFFGLIVGLIAKLVHPKDAPAGCLSTVAVGIAGTFVGGFINWILGYGTSPVESSGFFMSVIGGVLCLLAWRYYSLKNAPEGPRHFLTGRKLMK